MTKSNTLPTSSQPIPKEMLEELHQIRTFLEPKPAPPPPKGLWAEFLDFIGKAGVIGLAIGSSWAPTLERLFPHLFKTSSCLYQEP
jgi:hypothetical protein